VSQTRHGAWTPLRHRNFALLWFAALISNTGSWMHDLAAGWFMTTLAPTPAMVALVQAATTFPVFLLALPAGAIADNMDKRRLLLGVQWMMLLLAAFMGLMVLLGAAGKSTLLLVTFALGVCTAIVSPTWQSIIPRLVSKEDLQQAVALHAVGMNIARAIGPTIAGTIIVLAGIAWPFLLNSLSFIAVIVALWYWKAPPEKPRETAWQGLAHSMWTGMAHVGDNRALRNTLWRSAMFFVFGSCYWALLPLVARQQLNGGAKLFGLLVGFIGLGAVTGALLLPRLRRRFGLDHVITMGTLGTALAMTGFALLRVPALAMIAALLAGASWIASLSSLNVAAQLAVADWIRGRGMALFTAAFYGSLAFGSLVWGQIGSHLGLTCTLLLAAGGATLALAIATRLPVQTRN
jgi:predicted MFS family arabinose efflux permease